MTRSSWLNAGGDQMVISWLHRRWDSHVGRASQGIVRHGAPDTEAKRDLMDASAEGIEGAIKLAIRGQHTPAWPDLMRLEDVIDRLRDPAFTLLPEQLRKQISTQRVILALKAAMAPCACSMAKSSSMATAACVCGACARAK